jgi:hypothetical protein
LEYGGDEELAIAALLHDSVEDQGGKARLEDVRNRFGPRVAQIVEACSDSLADTAKERVSLLGESIRKLIWNICEQPNPTFFAYPLRTRFTTRARFFATYEPAGSARISGTASACPRTTRFGSMTVLQIYFAKAAGPALRRTERNSGCPKTREQVT